MVPARPSRKYLIVRLRARFSWYGSGLDSHGTAQGSLLGPPILILYVNDIFMSLEHETSIYMNADDTILMCKANDINMAVFEINVSPQPMLTISDQG